MDPVKYRPGKDPKTDTPVDLAWPSLARPEGKKLIYLDLMHWISLAKVTTGHRNGGPFTDALAACRQALNEGEVVFPLSACHYMEVLKIADPGQRRALASVMGELSRFETLVDSGRLHALEISASVDKLLSVPSSADSQALVGRGAGFAFGQSLALPNEFEMRLLAGPSDDEVEDLRKRGWNPAMHRTVMERRVVQEKEQAELFKKEADWRKGRLRDVVTAREWTIELFDPVCDEFDSRRVDMLKVFRSGTDEQNLQIARNFVRSMPSAEVAVEMKTRLHRQTQTKWDVNTIYDIDALSVALPYCDIVVTEKNAANGLNASGVSARMNTVVLTSLAELVPFLGA